MLCERKGAHLKVVPFDDRGVLDMDALDEMINEKTKIWLKIKGCAGTFLIHKAGKLIILAKMKA